MKIRDVLRRNFESEILKTENALRKKFKKACRNLEKLAEESPSGSKITIYLKTCTEPYYGSEKVGKEVSLPSNLTCADFKQITRYCSVEKQVLAILGCDEPIYEELRDNQVFEANKDYKSR